MIRLLDITELPAVGAAIATEAQKRLETSVEQCILINE
jgi:hypothetical protein